MKPSAFTYLRPTALAEAQQALRDDAMATPIAGGQSLIVMLSLRMAASERLIDLSRLPELSLCQEMPESIRLGAATTHAALEDGLVPDPSRGMLARVAGGIAYRAIRNFGTIGGAMVLADPAADWPVCLLALDATVLIATAAGERRLPVDAFLRGPYTTALEAGEIVLGFEIPRLAAGARWGYVKQARKQGAYADSLAAAVTPAVGEAPRIVLGATGNRATLLQDLAAALQADPGLAGTALRSAVLAAVRAADPEADAYRLRCHAANVERAIAQMRQP